MKTLEYEGETYDIVTSVVNVVDIKGQWLRAGDIFDIIIINARSRCYQLVLRNSNRGCLLGIDTDGKKDLSIDDILNCLRLTYKYNTWELLNKIEVELI